MRELEYICMLLYSEMSIFFGANDCFVECAVDMVDWDELDLQSRGR